jgi:predicted DNA-binding ribbon-helix-helix protein
VKSLVVKHSIVLAGHKTSVSLEEPFWRGLKVIAQARGQTIADLIVRIDGEREFSNLSSALRLFVLSYYQSRGGAERARGASGSLGLAH